mmetsp:Transcript_18771/g.61184  ORF Transcript_18771/g.61184 Transcript_18771/m.61184 type:complete len:220 (+) Transcript_18771:1145-1804(+)
MPVQSTNIQSVRVGCAPEHARPVSPFSFNAGCQSPFRRSAMVRRCASRSAACALSVTPRAAPKSVTLTWPAPVRRTFSGLRSPKQKPTSWIASSAATIEPRTKTVACVSRAPSPTTAEWRSPLAAYSSTRYASDRHRKLERRRATPGCEMRANTAISRAMLRSYLCCMTLAREITFTAYSGQADPASACLVAAAPLRMRRAYLTTPNAPRPSSLPKTRS